MTLYLTEDDIASLCQLALSDLPAFFSTVEKYLVDVPTEERDVFRTRLEFCKKDNRLILQFLKDLQRALDDTRAKVKETVSDAVEEAVEEALAESQTLIKVLKESERIVNDGYDPEFPHTDNVITEQVYEAEADAIRRYKEQENDLTEPAPAEAYRSKILERLEEIESAGYLSSSPAFKKYVLETTTEILNAGNTLLALEVAKGYIDRKYRDAITRRMEEVLEKRFGWQLVSIYYLMHALGVPRDISGLVEKRLSKSMLEDFKWIHSVLRTGNQFAKADTDRRTLRVKVSGLGMTDEQAIQAVQDYFPVDRIDMDERWLDIQIQGDQQSVKNVLQKLRELDVIVEDFEVL